MEAEKLWKEWASARVSPDNPVVTGSITFGIKAYKSQLKKLIEEADRNDGMYTHYKKWTSAELFDLIEKVQPPKS